VLREERLLWSWICDNLDTIQDQANTYEVTGEMSDLLTRTRHEEVSVWEWNEFLDDLAERVSWATGYAGLGDRPAGPGEPGRRAPVARQVDTGFGCPGGLCDRLATGGLLEPTPVCRILAKDMTLLP
jgi:hypothetical protein